MSTATATRTDSHLHGFVGDGDSTAPVLWAESVEANRWNGWSSPIVTAAQLAAWVEQTMPTTHVHEAGSDLFIADPTDPERWHDYFPAVGVTSDGAALYSMCGWCFLPFAPDCANCGAILDRAEYRQPAEDGRWECIGGTATCYGEGPYSLLDFDTAEAIGLDGTLRDGSDPYVWARLDDARLLYALAVTGRDVSYAEADPDTCQERYDNAQAAATLRWTEEGMERLTEWCVGSHASADDLARAALAETPMLLAIIRGDAA